MKLVVGRSYGIQYVLSLNQLMNLGLLLVTFIISFIIIKKGGNAILISQLANLKNCVEDVGLLEVLKFGLFYTCSNQHSNNPIRCKLDRVFNKKLWHNAYPHSFYIINPSLSFDHSPLLVFLQMDSPIHQIF